MALELEIEGWAEQQFGSCQLGDKRRTKRMVKIAAQAAAKPDASTPQQTEHWADLKAAYRLFDADEVTFDAVIAPHCAQSRAVAPGTWLVVNDTTELLFGYGRELSGVGRVGSFGQGFYLHSAMLVAPGSDELIGLGAQELYRRPLKKVQRVSSVQRKKKRTRETDVWGRVIDQVGPPPEGARFIHVCDRGADNFDVYCHLLAQRSGWVIRAAQLTRIVHDMQGRAWSLQDLISEQGVVGTYDLHVPAGPKQPARIAHMQVRHVQLTLPHPRAGVSRYVRSRGVEAVTMWAVETSEVQAPSGVEPLRWVLLTSETVNGFDDAWRVLEYYEQRPLIEDYHKCLKTGCRIENRQYQTGDRLGPVIGMLSVLAVRLLQLKIIARRRPDEPAVKIVPIDWLRSLRQLRRASTRITTVREFFRELAGLGGFLGRKGDGEPGWQTIWRGLETLLLCIRGRDTLQKRCG